MLHKDQFVQKYPTMAEGTLVRCKDGEKLGKISSLNSDSFVVKKGIFFPEDFIFRYDDIVTFTDGEVTINAYKEDLTEWRDQDYPGWSHVNDINEGRLRPVPRPEYQDRYRDWSDNAATTGRDNAAASRRDNTAASGRDNATVSGRENATSDSVRMPIVEEELEAQKTVRQAGEVRLRKVVHTELKHFTVPVMKEEVRIERTPVTDRTANVSEADAFREKTVAVPIMEEEVTVTKRPVVKEEVRVDKTRTEEEREVTGEVRKEDVQVDQDVSDK